MTTITLQEITPTFPTIKTDTIIKALQNLSPKYLPDVLQFIQFLEYKSIPTNLEPKANLPEPRQVKVAGKLNTITDSDCSFRLIAEQDSIIKGIAKSIDQNTLSNLLNKDVLVSGIAHFTSTGDLLTLEAEQIIIAKAQDMKIWGKVPTPLFVLSS